MTKAVHCENKADVRATKIEVVAERLQALALDLGAGARLPRIHELCTQFDISITTLTSALDHLEASGIVTRRRGSGIFVAAGVRRANVLLLCDAGIFAQPGLSPFWNLLIQSARARALSEALGFELHFAEAHYGPAPSKDDTTPPISPAVAGLIKAGRVDGALAVGIAPEATYYLEANHIPLVAFAGRGTHTVIIDMVECIRQGVLALAKAGAKRISLWEPYQTRVLPRDVVFHQTQHREAFQAALKEAELPYDEALVFQNLHLAPTPETIVTMPYQQQGHEMAMKVFGTAPQDRTVALPDAILSTDDVLTAGILSALRSCEIRFGATAAPDAICIATHANVGSHMLIGDEKKLILLEIDPAEVVEAQFAMLEKLMAGEVPDRTYIPAHLKVPDTHRDVLTTS
jgi:DNA-binding LacI/PurR family transcriptional regulator